MGVMEDTKDRNAAANGMSGKTYRAAEIATRLIFAIVFVVNVHCALSFMIDPAAYAGAYELSGVAGEVAVRGIGVAFLMWNATYPLVIVHPARHRALAGVVVAQQVIGLVGESAILLSLPAGHETLAAGIARFIAFDAAGLALMGAAFAWLCAVLAREKRFSRAAVDGPGPRARAHGEREGGVAIGDHTGYVGAPPARCRSNAREGVADAGCEGPVQGDRTPGGGADAKGGIR